MIEIDAKLAKELIRTQFPQWADLPITPVGNGGRDNKTFRLGEEMSVGLPRAFPYVAQVEKEHRWLPRLRPHLPLPIPVPLGLGTAGAGYPWPWSIYRWLDGERAHIHSIHRLDRFATDLAEFLVALREIDARDGPAAGAHNFYRGGSLSVYDAETRNSIEALADEIDVGSIKQVWDRALTTSWRGVGVWIHGDVAESNLLVKNGRVCAVIDFGCAAVGDPSCDLTIAWTFLDPAGRGVFRKAIALDPAAWERARGWAMWKALITLVKHRATNPTEANKARQVIGIVLDDHWTARAGV